MALVAQYLFEDNANDSSGNGYNGTATNVTYESAPSDKNFGKYVGVFNGSNSKISLPTLGLGGTGAKTIECWININAFKDWGALFGFGSTSLYTGLWCMPYAYSSYKGATCDLYGARPYFTNQNLTTGSWHHHVWVISSGTTAVGIKYYLDGTSISVASSENGSRSVNPTNANYSIGYRSVDNSCYLDAQIGNLRVYNEALTAATIQEHFNTESAPPPPQGFTQQRYL